MNTSPSSSRNHPTFQPSTPVWQQQTLPQPTVTPRSGYKQSNTRFRLPTQTTQTLPQPGNLINTSGLSPAPATMGHAHHPFLPPPAPKPPSLIHKKRLMRIFTLFLLVALGAIIYTIWTNAPTPSAVSGGLTMPTSITLAQNTSNSTTPLTSISDGGTITVYITGAVKHPGVYTLPTGARIYQLVQAAGGTLPDADLVSLNMATKLSDGQEVDVLLIGQTPPYTGGSGITTSGTAGSTGTTGTAGNGNLININTASADEMRQALHISSVTANKIIAYRTQYGPYTSVDQLLQVVSRSIYDKIKGLVTVS